jgi:hypothetical protein
MPKFAPPGYIWTFLIKIEQKFVPAIDETLCKILPTLLKAEVISSSLSFVFFI